MVSARELNYERVPAIAQTWVNEHLVYTHGYGFTMSPVNTAGPDGLPAYFIRGIDHVPSSEAVRDSIPINEPRIYFGELTNTYIMTNTTALELDFPSGNDNVYTTYLGRAGINLGNYWRRLLFARHLNDWRMLFTEDFTPNTRLLFRRNIADRVQAIAPFLRFDTDPYLVIADIDDASSQWGTGDLHGSDPPTGLGLEAYRATSPDIQAENFNTQTEENYLYWIIDAYTVSARYPYSDPGDNDFNYIRNSVKVVIDAYNGAIRFFVTDADDPIIQTWNRLLPDMFIPLEVMPTPLQDHIRYPQDLFQVQSQALMTYHM
ncbi:MAG: COG1615 family transporter, partial [Leptolyngbyaceae cyanobacterium SM2_3_12]|nr:COG1615 family transporter [Leptolyngbyaceae cyanobacterium SM2_3_12]